VVENCRELLDGRGVIVDFGYGESPVTTEEWARSLPGLEVIGIEKLSPSPRGGEGRGEGYPTLLSGDVSTLASVGPTAIVRAMNVLRGYREEEVPALHQALAAGLIDGGLLIEGSTDTEGHVTVVWLLRKKGTTLVRESLLFHTDFSRGFSPWLFRDWLPRDLRRSARPGTAIYALLSEWDSQAGHSADPRTRFVESIRGVMKATPWELEHGFARGQLG
jgi:hypothetical protein